MSSDGQAASGLGLAAQRRAIQAAARGIRGAKLVEIVADEGVSASRHLFLLRRGGARLDGLLARGDHLIIAKMDRAFRWLGDFALLMARWRSRGVQVHILDVGVDTSTPAGELVCGVMAVIAQWEAQRLGERTRAAFVEVRRRGQSTNGRAPLGRRLQGKTLVADGRELRTMAALARLRASGLSWRKIAAEARRRKLKTRDGKPWNHQRAWRAGLRWRAMRSAAWAKSDQPYQQREA